MNEPRKWWLAVLMSLVKPGLGQIYNGQLKKGLFVIVLGYSLHSVIFFVALHSLSAYTILSCVMAVALYYVVAAVDSIVVARKYNAVYILKSYNKFYVYLVTLIVLGTVNYFYSGYVKSNFIEAFKFPTASMEPTLLIGDHILVDRSSAARNPKRGDIIVFEYPKDPDKNYLKRVVAIGGDTLEIRDATIYVNGTEVIEPYLKHSYFNDISSRPSSANNYGEVVVPNDAYFVLGDNRDNSFDSRMFGFIRHSKVKGTARSIYWSWDNISRTVRWERIGQVIR